MQANLALTSSVDSLIRPRYRVSLRVKIHAKRHVTMVSLCSLSGQKSACFRILYLMHLKHHSEVDL